MRMWVGLSAAVGLAVTAGGAIAVAQNSTGAARSAAQAQTAPQAKSTVHSVATLAASGYTIVSSIPNTPDNKQAVLVLQKAAEVYYCPIWTNNLGPVAGQCAKAQ